MSKKLIVSDIDGTFLRTDRSLDGSHVETVRHLLESGHFFALATGRIFGTARMITHAMGIDLFVISNNGASIRHTASAEPIFRSTMPRELLEDIYRVAERHDYGYQVYTDMRMVASRPNPFLNKYIEERESLPEELRYEVIMPGNPRETEQVEKVAYTFYDKPPTEEMLRDLRAIPGIVAVQSHRFGIDISLRGVDKGSGLRRLADHLGVDPADTVAFGDEDNDVSLLRAAGTGVAMSNATEAAKRAADFVTGSNDESGLTYAVRRMHIL